MNAMLNFVILLGVFMLIGTSIRLWAWVYQRRQSGQPMLEPLVPLPWVRWGLVDLGLLMILVVALQLVVASFMNLLPLPEQVVRLDQVRDQALGIHDESAWTSRGGPRWHGDTGMEADEAVDLTAAAERVAGSEYGTQQRLLASMVVANLVWVVLGLAGLRYWRGISFRELGFDSRRWREDLRLGGAAFCMLAPPVYLLQLILVQLWPSEHPLVEMIRDDESGRLVWLGGMAAVIAAPLFEELAFRLFLQGWLENLVRAVDQEPLPATEPYRQDSANGAERFWQLLVQGWSPTSEQTRPGDNGWIVDSGQWTADRDDGQERRSGDHASIEDHRGDASRTARLASSRLLWVPILASSLIFALLHYNHGPDWIPLLLLALGLGYLYQRTRRILPCILVHLLLNLTSFCMLLLDMASRS